MKRNQKANKVIHSLSRGTAAQLAWSYFSACCKGAGAGALAGGFVGACLGFAEETDSLWRLLGAIYLGMAGLGVGAVLGGVVGILQRLRY